MQFLKKVNEKWKEFCVWIQPAVDFMGDVFVQLFYVLGVIWKHLLRLRKVFLAVPVAWAAIMLALKNIQDLPKEVGLNLLESGEFEMTISRELAVLGPVAVTALCLLLMFCSRRTLTPWFVSLVSLLLPVAILILNTFPT